MALNHYDTVIQVVSEFDKTINTYIAKNPNDSYCCGEFLINY